MSPSERRTAARAALLLLLVSTARWGWERSRAEPLTLPDTAGVRERLLERGREALEERELRERPLGAGERLDPNRASEAELDRLPGVGPATARAIVEARERTGGFLRPEDLLAARGVGPGTLERMRAHLEIGPAPPGLRRPGRAADRPSGHASGPLDLNRAGEGELLRLPGVGPALAGRIVALRERRGRFDSAADLLEVRGIGPATLERMRPLVTPP